MIKPKDRGGGWLVWLLLYIPVVWAALLLAQSLGGGLPDILSRLAAALKHPFQIIWTEHSLVTILACTGLYITGIFIYTSEQGRTREGEEHGSAAWATPKQVNAMFCQKESKILTRHVRLGLDTHRHRRSINVLVIGGSGAAKTRSYVKPNILEANTNYVVTDPKMEVLTATGGYLKSQGYDIRVLNLVNLAQSDGYNPFRYLRDEKDALKLVNNLIQATTPKGSHESDPFWTRAETALLQAIILMLFQEAPEREQNFSMVMRVLEYAEVKEEDEDYISPLDLLFRAIEREKPDSVAVRQYKVFKLAAGKTYHANVIGNVESIPLPTNDTYLTGPLYGQLDGIAGCNVVVGFNQIEGQDAISFYATFEKGATQVIAHFGQSIFSPNQFNAILDIVNNDEIPRDTAANGTTVLSSNDYTQIGYVTTTMSSLATMNGISGKAHTCYVYFKPGGISTDAENIILLRIDSNCRNLRNSQASFPIYAANISRISIIPVLFPKLTAKHIQKVKEDEQQAKASYLGMLTQIFQGFSLLKLFHSFQEINREHERENSNLCKKKIRFSQLNSALYAGVFGCGNLVFLGTWVVGLAFVLRGYITLPELIIFSQLMTFVAGPIQIIGERYASFVAASAVFKRILRFLQKAPEEENSWGNSQLEQIQNIQLHNVQVSAGKKILLDNVELALHQGDRVAILGESGSGKSTLIRYLAALVTGTGTYEINGSPTNSYSYQDFRKNIAFMEQNSVVFNGSVRDNLTLFSHFHTDDSTLVQTLGDVGLTKWYGTRGNSLDAPIGTERQRMSGGEERRLNLARILLKNADLVLLDEPTTGLDAESRLFIEKTISGLQCNILMVVMHEYSPEFLSTFNRVINVENGHKVETL